MAIHLSGLPGEPSLSGGGRAAHFPRLALLRVGFTEPPRSPSVLVRSYRTVSPLPVRTRRPAIGGFLSVALSCGSPRLAVSQHPALWSPDLPRHDPAERPVPRPPGRLTVTTNSATTRHVMVTGQRIGRVSSMSGGPRQLFDPEAPPEAAASDLRTVSGGDEAQEDRRGVHSIGGVYEQVEGALNQAFPRNRHLWVRGEIRQVSDHRSGHLYLSLVDPEDESPRRDRSRGGVPTLNVKCWRSSWAPLRHGLAKQGIELAEGMVVVLRGSLDLYRAKGEISLILAEVDVTALLGQLAATTGAAAPDARRRGAAAAQCAPCPCPRSRSTSAWSPARVPRGVRTSSGSSRVRGSGSVSRTCGSPCRAPVRRPPSPAP